ncbi:ABC transporter substrate-binding protein [Clostridium sp.]|uniref:ABC transporter substrate-binding protein n=1 Tax=Clostridium sp. TaxID=1506 RepID=UPI00290AAD3A|nr:ABC transporter substrate-binding protein [Clostridium sp.]MDU5108006.1 ABC transporter substrate-binding protein [Clostridium sp.]
MKIRKRVIFLLIIGFLIIFSINLILSKSNRRDLKGDIVLWSNEENYHYFLEVANEFKERNKKVNIHIINIGSEDCLEKIQELNEKDLPNIVELNFVELEKIKEKIDFIDENKSIIEMYNKNFKDSRIQEIKIHEDYYGVPFESNPIALYVRNDILNKYGYEASELNTWKDLIEVGNEIKNKSSGEINIFSNKDKGNIELLIISQLVDYEKDSYTYTKEDILKEFNNIYKDEYIAEDNNYLYRIASLDFYRDIVEDEELGIWTCKNPPSYKIGENKLYALGGKNLVALNVEKNRDAIKEFIAFAATNKDLLSKELRDNKFFPSSLYSLTVKEEENKIENIEGNSPFLILVNIAERAPSIKNFDKLKEILNDIYYN